MTFTLMKWAGLGSKVTTEISDYRWGGGRWYERDFKTHIVTGLETVNYVHIDAK